MNTLGGSTAGVPQGGPQRIGLVGPQGNQANTAIKQILASQSKVPPQGLQQPGNKVNPMQTAHGVQFVQPPNGGNVYQIQSSHQGNMNNSVPPGMQVPLQYGGEMAMYKQQGVLGYMHTGEPNMMRQAVIQPQNVMQMGTLHSGDMAMQTAQGVIMSPVQGQQVQIQGQGVQMAMFPQVQGGQQYMMNAVAMPTQNDMQPYVNNTQPPQQVVHTMQMRPNVQSGMPVHSVAMNHQPWGGMHRGDGKTLYITGNNALSEHGKSIQLTHNVPYKTNWNVQAHQTQGMNHDAGGGGVGVRQEMMGMGQHPNQGMMVGGNYMQQQHQVQHHVPGYMASGGSQPHPGAPLGSLDPSMGPGTSHCDIGMDSNIEGMEKFQGRMRHTPNLHSSAVTLSVTSTSIVTQMASAQSVSMTTTYATSVSQRPMTTAKVSNHEAHPVAAALSSTRAKGAVEAPEHPPQPQGNNTLPSMSCFAGMLNHSHSVSSTAPRPLSSSSSISLPPLQSFARLVSHGRGLNSSHNTPESSLTPQHFDPEGNKTMQSPPAQHQLSAGLTPSSLSYRSTPNQSPGAMQPQPHHHPQATHSNQSFLKSEDSLSPMKQEQDQCYPSGVMGPTTITMRTDPLPPSHHLVKTDIKTEKSQHSAIMSRHSPGTTFCQNQKYSFTSQSGAMSHPSHSPSWACHQSQQAMSQFNHRHPSGMLSIPVPFGWKRVLEGGAVVYYSPSLCRLTSIHEIRQYLQSDHTCKCGLECPLMVEKVFNYDPQVASQQWCRENLTHQNDLTKFCNHKRKIIAMATLQTSAGYHSDSQGEENLTPGKHGPLLSPSKKEPGGKRRKKAKSNTLEQKSVSQLLSQRDKLKSAEMQKFEMNQSETSSDLQTGCDTEGYDKEHDPAPQNIEFSDDPEGPSGQCMLNQKGQGQHVGVLHKRDPAEDLGQITCQSLPKLSPLNQVMMPNQRGRMGPSPMQMMGPPNMMGPMPQHQQQQQQQQPHLQMSPHSQQMHGMMVDGGPQGMMMDQRNMMAWHQQGNPPMTNFQMHHHHPQQQPHQQQPFMGQHGPRGRFPGPPPGGQHMQLPMQHMGMPMQGPMGPEQQQHMYQFQQNMMMGGSPPNWHSGGANSSMFVVPEQFQESPKQKKKTKPKKKKKINHVHGDQGGHDLDSSMSNPDDFDCSISPDFALGGGSDHIPMTKVSPGDAKKKARSRDPNKPKRPAQGITINLANVIEAVARGNSPPPAVDGLMDDLIMSLSQESDRETPKNETLDTSLSTTGSNPIENEASAGNVEEVRGTGVDIKEEVQEDEGLGQVNEVRNEDVTEPQQQEILGRDNHEETKHSQEDNICDSRLENNTRHSISEGMRIESTIGDAISSVVEAAVERGEEPHSEDWEQKEDSGKSKNGGTEKKVKNKVLTHVSDVNIEEEVAANVRKILTPKNASTFPASHMLSAAAKAKVDPNLSQQYMDQSKRLHHLPMNQEEYHKQQQHPPHSQHHQMNNPMAGMQQHQGYNPMHPMGRQGGVGGGPMHWPPYMRGPSHPMYRGMREGNMHGQMAHMAGNPHMRPGMSPRYPGGRMSQPPHQQQQQQQPPRRPNHPHHKGKEQTPIEMVQNMISGLEATQNALAAAVTMGRCDSTPGKRRKSASSDSGSNSGRNSARPSSRGSARPSGCPSVGSQGDGMEAMDVNSEVFSKPTEIKQEEEAEVNERLATELPSCEEPDKHQGTLCNTKPEHTPNRTTSPRGSTPVTSCTGSSTPKSKNFTHGGTEGHGGSTPTTPSHSSDYAESQSNQTTSGTVPVSKCESSVKTETSPPDQMSQKPAGRSRKRDGSKKASAPTIASLLQTSQVSTPQIIMGAAQNPTNVVQFVGHQGQNVGMTGDDSASAQQMLCYPGQNVNMQIVSQGAGVAMTPNLQNNGHIEMAMGQIQGHQGHVTMAMAQGHVNIPFVQEQFGFSHVENQVPGQISIRPVPNQGNWGPQQYQMQQINGGVVQSFGSDGTVVMQQYQQIVPQEQGHIQAYDPKMVVAMQNQPQVVQMMTQGSTLNGPTSGLTHTQPPSIVVHPGGPVGQISPHTINTLSPVYSKAIHKPTDIVYRVPIVQTNIQTCLAQSTHSQSNGTAMMPTISVAETSPGGSSGIPNPANLTEAVCALVKGQQLNVFGEYLDNNNEEGNLHQVASSGAAHVNGDLSQGLPQQDQSHADQQTGNDGAVGGEESVAQNLQYAEGAVVGNGEFTPEGGCRQEDTSDAACQTSFSTTSSIRSLSPSDIPDDNAEEYNQEIENCDNEMDTSEIDNQTEGHNNEIDNTPSEINDTREVESMETQCHTMKTNDCDEIPPPPHESMVNEPLDFTNQHLRRSEDCEGKENCEQDAVPPAVEMTREENCLDLSLQTKSEKEEDTLACDPIDEPPSLENHVGEEKESIVEGLGGEEVAMQDTACDLSVTRQHENTDIDQNETKECEVTEDETEADRSDPEEENSEARLNEDVDMNHKEETNHKTLPESSQIEENRVQIEENVNSEQIFKLSENYNQNDEMHNDIEGESSESEDEIPEPRYPRDFNTGEIVWGQIRGYPSWPGRVVQESEVKSSQKTDTEQGKVWVKWYGDHSFTQVATESLKTLSEGLEAHHKATKNHRKGRKMNTNLEAAIQEAMNELDKQEDDTESKQISVQKNNNSNKPKQLLNNNKKQKPAKR